MRARLCFVRRLSRNFFCRIWAAAALLFAGSVSAMAAPLTPASPEVQDAINRGIAMVEKSADGRLGAKALIGLVLAKAGKSDDHPKIKDAVDSIHREIDAGPEKFTADIYSTGLSIMCLVAVDPKKHLYDIEKLVRSLELRQKKDGAWGYPVGGANGEKCDTSMTQFALLGLWEAADEAEVDVPARVWDKAARWLIRAQDPTGAWGYQGNVSAKLGERVKQDSTKHTMAVAGLCSVFICRDQLGLGAVRHKREDVAPKVLKPVESADEALARVKTKLDPKLLLRARASGARWMTENFTIDKPQGFLHYYLYALERYESFREEEELDANRGNWYDRGAKFLLQTQEDDGSWKSQAGPVPDTCFAMLFLLRSMKKSLERSKFRYPEGILVGGRGVPATPKPRLRGGQVTVEPAADSVAAAAFLQAAEPGAENTAPFRHALETLADLAATGQAAVASEVAPKVRPLVTHPRPEVRLAAVRALGCARSLDEGPTLIRALADDDVEVLLAAREALAKLSRRPESLGPNPNSPEKERHAAIAAWKDWYRTLRPEVDLE